MSLRTVYASLDEIPEKYRDLFTEKGEKWELTGVEGIKTPEDIARVQTSLQKEREAHKSTKQKLASWDGLDADEIHAKLDRISELELAAGGKLDEKAIGELVEKRVTAKLATETGPLQRQIEKLTKERDGLKTSVTELSADISKRTLQDSLRPILTEMKVLPEHHEDVFMYAERHLTRTEDGQFLTKDGVGVTPGLGVKDWLDEFVPRKPGWLPGNVGGGATGGRGGSGGANPWAKETFNLTQQGEYVRTHGVEKAQAMAKAAGVSLERPVHAK